MSGDAEEGAGRAKLSRKAVDHARNFLSALFMGLRTAQIHDPANRAFDNAVQVLSASARELYSTTGGFTIQFVEESVFLNGVRLRIADGGFASMRTLRSLLESRELGGIEMRTAPTLDSVRKLILLFASQPRPEDGVSKEDLQKSQIGLLGVQRFSDGQRNIKVDRRVFAAQCYAKLVLALREQLERLEQAREVDWAPATGAPRLRAVRVIQDLVELGGDRADFLLRLAANPKGGTRLELYGVNTCLLSISLGHGMGLPRQELVDFALAALYHVLGAKVEGDRVILGLDQRRASLARILVDSGVSRSGYTRSLVVGEMVPGASGRREPHWYSRLLHVAAAYQRLVMGLDDGRAVEPLAALGLLSENRESRYDPRAVDLLINVLRAYPVGAEVVLDGGEHGMVISHAGGSRWDRPIVRVGGDAPRTIDLMLRQEGRFLSRIQATRLFLGEKAKETTLDELGFPPLIDQQLLRSISADGTGDVPGADYDLSAHRAGVQELLDAIDLPDDLEDPPEVDWDAVEPLDAEMKIVRGGTSEMIGGTVELEEASSSPLELDDSTLDEPDPMSLLGLYTEPKDTAALLLPVEPEPLGNTEEWDRGHTPRELALITLAPTSALPSEIDELRRENALLKSYVEALVETIQSSNLPLPTPPEAPAAPPEANTPRLEAPTEPPTEPPTDPRRVAPRRGRRPMPRR